MARCAPNEGDPARPCSRIVFLSGLELLEEGLEIHLIPAIHDLLTLDNEEGRPDQYAPLATCGEAEMISAMGHYGSPSDRDTVAFGNHVLYFDFQIREGAQKVRWTVLKASGPSSTESASGKPWAFP